MMGTVGIAPPPHAYSDDATGLLRLASNPDLAQQLLDHRQAWVDAHQANEAILKKIGKHKDVDAALAKAEARSKQAGETLEQAQADYAARIDEAQTEARAIVDAAKIKADGLDEREAMAEQFRTNLQVRSDDLDARERKIVSMEQSTAQAKRAAAADRKAAADAKKKVEAMLAGVK